MSEEVAEEHAFGESDPKERSRGWLNAVDADTGEVKWVWQAPTPMIAGVTPTAGNIVLTGDLNGHLHAFDAVNGKLLYTRAIGGPIGGGVITYATGASDGGEGTQPSEGTQRIAVASGMNSPIWPWKGGPAKITVLGLPE